MDCQAPRSWMIYKLTIIKASSKIPNNYSVQLLDQTIKTQNTNQIKIKQEPSVTKNKVY